MRSERADLRAAVLAAIEDGFAVSLKIDAAGEVYGHLARTERIAEAIDVDALGADYEAWFDAAGVTDPQLGEEGAGVAEQLAWAREDLRERCYSDYLHSLGDERYGPERVRGGIVDGIVVGDDRGADLRVLTLQGSHSWRTLGPGASAATRVAHSSVIVVHPPARPRNMNRRSGRGRRCASSVNWPATSAAARSVSSPSRSAGASSQASHPQCGYSSSCHRPYRTCSPGNEVNATTSGAPCGSGWSRTTRATRGSWASSSSASGPSTRSTTYRSTSSSSSASAAACSTA